MREPLPLYCAASGAYAAAANAGRDPVAAGRKAWTSEWRFDREDREPEHQLVLGGVRSFDDVLAESPRPEDQGDGWDATEATRFGRFARRLWDGLLSCESVTGT
jgi:exodeoxyribonuclease V gamma subunit